MLRLAILRTDFDLSAERKNTVALILKTFKIRRYELVLAMALASAFPRHDHHGISILSVLVDHGADIGISPVYVLSSPEISSSTGRAPLLNACLENEKSIYRYGHQMILWALSDNSNYAYVAQELFQRGVQPDQPLATPYTPTALNLAIKWPAALGIFISDENIHPNIEVKNGAGHTPLCKAVCEGEYKSATLLLNNGASPEPIGRGQRPMDCRIHNKDDRMVRLLWDKGASIKSVGKGQHRVVRTKSQWQLERLLNSWAENPS